MILQFCGLITWQSYRLWVAVYLQKNTLAFCGQIKHVKKSILASTYYSLVENFVEHFVVHFVEHFVYYFIEHFFENSQQFTLIVCI